MGLAMGLAGVNPFSRNTVLPGPPPAVEGAERLPAEEAASEGDEQRIADLSADAESALPPQSPVNEEKGGNGTVPAVAALPDVVNLEEIVWPVTGDVVQPFGWYRHPETQEWRFHPGIRMKPNRPDASVRAVLSGIVDEISVDPGGYRVRVVHAQGWTSVYSPLATVEVAVGDWVNPGDVLGVFHGALPGALFEFRMERGGEAVNPEDYLYRP